VVAFAPAKPSQKLMQPRPNPGDAATTHSPAGTANYIEWLITAALTLLCVLSVLIVFGDDLGQLFGQKAPAQQPSQVPVLPARK
jgi:hypothetical protein